MGRSPSGSKHLELRGVVNGKVNFLLICNFNYNNLGVESLRLRPSCLRCWILLKKNSGMMPLVPRSSASVYKRRNWSTLLLSAGSSNPWKKKTRREIQRRRWKLSQQDFRNGPSDQWNKLPKVKYCLCSLWPSRRLSIILDLVLKLFVGCKMLPN